MKFVYCYFGLLRTANNCLQSHKANLPQISESDVYVHTWYQSTITKYWHGSSIENFVSVAGKLDKFAQLNVKKILLEQQHLIPGDDLVEVNGHRIYWKSGVYLWKTILGSALLLKENAPHDPPYDRIIFIRPDLEIKSSLLVSDFLSFDNELLFCGSLDSASTDGKVYRCEDLIFSIKFNDLDLFIDFCKERIDIQYQLKDGKLMNGPNPLLDFCNRLKSPPIHLDFIYSRDFEIKRKFNFFVFFLTKIKKILKIIIRFLK